MPALAVAAIFAILTWLVLAGVPGRVGGSVQREFYAATARAGFTVQAILVKGRINADPNDLRAAIGIQRGMPIFAFRPRQAMENLNALPWIKSVKVERRLPDTIYLKINERVPVALWQNKGQLKLVDGEGVILTDRDLGSFRDLLIIVGQDAPAHIGELAGLLDLDPQLKSRVEAAMFVSDRRWDMRLKNGLTVRLPETDPGIALARLAKAQRDDGIMDKNLTIIDLRDADRIIVATKPGAAQDIDPAGRDHSI